MLAPPEGLRALSRGASPYVPPVPGHGQFSDQISLKTYVATPSFYCEMCPRKVGHAQFQKRDFPPDIVSDFGKPTYLPKNRTSFMDIPLVHAVWSYKKRWEIVTSLVFIFANVLPKILGTMRAF